MDELKINYGVIQECIGDLQTLIEKYPPIIRVSAMGGGQMVDSIEKMADMYDLFYKAVISLSEETEVFLNNLLEKFKTMDENMSVN